MVSASPDSASGNVMHGVGLSLLGFATFSLHDALIKSVDAVPCLLYTSDAADE